MAPSWIKAIWSTKLMSWNEQAPRVDEQQANGEKIPDCCLLFFLSHTSSIDMWQLEDLTPHSYRRSKRGLVTISVQPLTKNRCSPHFSYTRDSAKLLSRTLKTHSPSSFNLRDSSSHTLKDSYKKAIIINSICTTHVAIYIYPLLSSGGVVLRNL